MQAGRPKNEPPPPLSRNLSTNTAEVESAKTEVRARSTKLNRDTAGMVEKWMRKMEVGHPEFLGPTDFAEDCRTVNY